MRGDDTTVQVLTLSARAPDALRELAQAYARRLADENPPALQDLCYSATLRRTHHDQRLALVGSSTTELRLGLANYLDNWHPAELATGRGRSS